MENMVRKLAPENLVETKRGDNAESELRAYYGHIDRVMSEVYGKSKENISRFFDEIYKDALERRRTRKQRRWFWKFMGMDVKRFDLEEHVQLINLNETFGKFGGLYCQSYGRGLRRHPEETDAEFIARMRIAERGIQLAPRFVTSEAHAESCMNDLCPDAAAEHGHHPTAPARPFMKPEE